MAGNLAGFATKRVMSWCGMSDEKADKAATVVKWAVRICMLDAADVGHNLVDVLDVSDGEFPEVAEHETLEPEVEILEPGEETLEVEYGTIEPESETLEAEHEPAESEEKIDEAEDHNILRSGMTTAAVLADIVAEQNKAAASKRRHPDNKPCKSPEAKVGAAASFGSTVNIAAVPGEIVAEHNKAAANARSKSPASSTVLPNRTRQPNDKQRQPPPKAKADAARVLSFLQKLRALRVEFEKFDKDRSGSIDAHELKEVMTSVLGHEPTEDVVKATMNDGDKDGDGAIDFEEFVRMMSREKDYSELDKIMEEAFSFFDLDGKGKISVDQLQYVICNNLGLKMSKREILQMVKEVDTNNDQEIDLLEFYILIFNNKRLAAKIEPKHME